MPIIYPRAMAGLLAVLALFAAALLPARPAAAQAMATSAEQAILVDLTTGRILFERNADQRMGPSSMTKLMTVLLAFDAIADSRISPDYETIVSERAWARNVEGSLMFLEVDDTVPIRDLIRGIIVISGNDASIALAEALAGSEDAFAQQMNRKAQELGMRNSHFTNASGLPHPQHYSTARDLAMLGAQIIRAYPQYYPVFAEPEYQWGDPADPRTPDPQQNRLNRAYQMSPDIDGLKTGHTEAAGYGAVMSGARNGRRVMLVINGLDSASARISEGVRLINWGLNGFDVYDIFQPGDTVGEVSVWRGQRARIPAVVNARIRMTLSPDELRGLEARVELHEALEAPIAAGDEIGMLVLALDGRDLGRYPVHAGENVAELGLGGRLIKNAGHLLSAGAE